MSFSTRIALGLVALVTIMLSNACGGSDGGNDMRLVLTDDGCTYEGNETPEAGAFTVDVENQSSVDGAFALAAIAEGSTIDDLEPFLEKARRQFQRSGTLPDPPAFYSQVVRVGVASGTSSLLPADVAAGTYALTCFNDDAPTWRVFLAGQLDVTE